jgi:hypothetical protein|tara:strand:+ start:4607 stop:4858 length:252 start_codon:yes stop_codon:yes gene_type:complete
MKTTFQEILSTDLTLGSFPVSSKIFSLGREAEIIAKVVQNKIDEDGEFAKISCSNIVDWMNELAEQAQVCLDLQMEKDLKNSK